MAQAIIEGEIKRVNEYLNVNGQKMEVYIEGYDWIQFYCEGDPLEKYRSLLAYPNMVRLEGELSFTAPVVLVLDVFKKQWPLEPKRIHETLPLITVRSEIDSVDTNEMEQDGLMHLVELTDMHGMHFVLFKYICPVNVKWLKPGKTIGFRGVYQGAKNIFSINTVKKINKPLV